MPALCSHEGGGAWPGGVGGLPPGPLGAGGSLFGDGTYSSNIYVGGVLVQPSASYQPSDIMPTATADTTGTWVFSSSGAYTGTPAYAAANDTTPGASATNFTTWNSAGAGGTAWWQAAKNNGVPETIDKYRIHCNTSTPLRTPTAFQLLGSNTGAFAGEQVVLDSRSGLTWAAGEAKTFTLSAPVSYLYYRINMTAYGVGGDGYYNLGEVELLPPALTDVIVITGAATVAPDGVTGAAGFSCKNIVLDGASASLTPTVNCKGLLGFVTGKVVLLNGAKIHMDKLGKAGNFGNLTAYTLAPLSIRKKLKQTLHAAYTVLGEGAAGGASGSGPGITGSAAAAMQTGGGGAGGSYSTGAVTGRGGKGGPCCGGSGGGGSYYNNGVAPYGPGMPAEDYGGKGGDAQAIGNVPGGGGAGQPVGTGNTGNGYGYAGEGSGGGLLMLFAGEGVSLRTGCIVSADGAKGGQSNAICGASAGGGCVVIVTRSGGYTNLGTVRASGGAIYTSGGGATNPGAGGLGSVNIFQNAE